MSSNYLKQCCLPAFNLHPLAYSGSCESVVVSRFRKPRTHKNRGFIHSHWSSTGWGNFTAKKKTLELSRSHLYYSTFYLYPLTILFLHFHPSTLPLKMGQMHHIVPSCYTKLKTFYPVNLLLRCLLSDLLS